MRILIGSRAPISRAQRPAGTALHSTQRVDDERERPSGGGRPVKLDSPPADVPSLIFSETMRDIDLFVSVANAANDPEWEHRNLIRDWNERLVEDLRASGETRRDTLETLIPRLKVANYSGVSNSRSLLLVLEQAKRVWYKWLCRRSQRKRLTWERFADLLRDFPLPRPRITVRIWGS